MMMPQTMLMTRRILSLNRAEKKEIRMVIPRNHTKEAVEEPRISWVLTAPGLPARNPPKSRVPSMRAWGLNQVTTQALAATWGRGISTSTLWSMVGLSFNRPMPIQMTTAPPASRMSIFSQVNRSIRAPTPKKQASARLMSKKMTMRAVRMALCRGRVRAVLMTNRFCIPIGAT